MATAPVKPLGVFRELPGAPLTAPAARELIDSEMSDRVRRLLAFYLIQGAVLRYTMERLPDVLDQEEIFLTGGLRTDGEWYWRADLAHYVLKYGLALPGEFLAHLEESDWTPPVLTEEECGVLAAELRRAGG